MKTGKLIRHPKRKSQNRNDEKSYIRVRFLKKAEDPGGKLRPEDKDSTCLPELSPMNNTHFRAIHY